MIVGGEGKAAEVYPYLPVSVSVPSFLFFAFWSRTWFLRETFENMSKGYLQRLGETVYLQSDRGNSELLALTYVV